MRHVWTIYLSLALLGAIVILQFQQTSATREVAERARAASTPFMTIHALNYADGVVTTERTIQLDHAEFPEGVVADWLVTVVRDNRVPPSCRTDSGPEIDQGWSVYDQFEATTQALPFDVWVGDPGCYDRLTNGVYHMHVTWTPRLRTLAPARTSMTFSINKDEDE